MPVPPNEVQARVNEFYALIKKNNESLRQGKLTALQGNLRNEVNRFSNQSPVTQRARGAGVVMPAATAGASTFAKFLIPVLALPLVSHVVGAVKTGLDKLSEKLIEHFQKKALSAGFDVRSDLTNDEWKTDVQKLQGEYAVQKLTQAIIDADRKVEDARKEMEDAYAKVTDCCTFVIFLARAEYFYHRIDRLEMYKTMMQIWMDGVSEQLRKLQEVDCKAMRDQTMAAAKNIIAKPEIHLDNCSGKPFCLFKPEWVKYLYQERPWETNPTQGPPRSPSPLPRTQSGPLVSPSTPGAAPRSLSWHPGKK